MLKQFSADEIVDYWFVAGMAQQGMVKDREKHMERLGEFLKKKFKDTAMVDYNFEISNLIKNFESLHGQAFDMNDTEGLKWLSNPSYSKVARASKELRDIRIVSMIKEEWDEGKSVFAVYGSGHAITQEPALRKLLV